jgi:hypothetical protein
MPLFYSLCSSVTQVHFCQFFRKGRTFPEKGTIPRGHPPQNQKNQVLKGLNLNQFSLFFNKKPVSTYFNDPNPVLSGQKVKQKIPL